eukprot:6214080-Pleurochrysis_carterae.AAC.2
MDTSGSLVAHASSDSSRLNAKKCHFARQSFVLKSYRHLAQYVGVPECTSAQYRMQLLCRSFILLEASSHIAIPTPCSHWMHACCGALESGAVAPRADTWRHQGAVHARFVCTQATLKLLFASGREKIHLLHLCDSQLKIRKIEPEIHLHEIQRAMGLKIGS